MDSGATSFVSGRGCLCSTSQRSDEDGRLGTNNVHLRIQHQGKEFAVAGARHPLGLKQRGCLKFALVETPSSTLPGLHYLRAAVASVTHDGLFVWILPSTVFDPHEMWWLESPSSVGTATAREQGGNPRPQPFSSIKNAPFLAGGGSHPFARWKTSHGSPRPSDSSLEGGPAQL